MNLFWRFFLLFSLTPIITSAYGQLLPEKKALFSQGGPLQDYAIDSQEDFVEKVYLHLNSNVFSPGDDIWYSIYLVLAHNHHFSSKSKVIHVDLIDSNNRIITSQTQRLINGKGNGSMELPKNIPIGTYQIRGYTNWMRNFEEKYFFHQTLEILRENKSSAITATEADSLDLQFFPESGHLVNSLETNVAFKAISKHGKENEINGIVINSSEEIVSDIKTLARGTGSFYLRPKTSQTYTVILSDGSQWNLPTILNDGYVLTVDAQDPDNLNVRVQATDSLRTKPFSIVGSMRNQEYFQNTFRFNAKPYVQFKIPTAKIPSGVLVLTLYDENRRPWCERAVFVNNASGLKITANLNKENISRRASLAIDVLVKDQKGNPISTEMSIAVNDANQILKNENSTNIGSYLLLQSDTNGHISNPGVLFKDQKRATLYELDLVMQTHGWRRYNWPEYVADMGLTKKYSALQGLSLYGTAYDLKNKPLGNTTLKVIAKSEEETTIYSMVTDSLGRFTIQELDHNKLSTLQFSAYSAKNRPLNLTVSLNRTTYNPPPTPRFQGALQNEKLKIEDSYWQFAQMSQQMDSLYGPKKTIHLDETVVKGKKLEKIERSLPSIYGVTPDDVIYADDYANNQVLQLVRRFAGVRVTYDNRVGIRGGGGPLWVIDGVPVGDDDSLFKGGSMKGPELVPGIILSLDYNSVERVEILRGSSAASWGMKAGHNGVILIYTKKGNTVETKVSSPSHTVQGHSGTKEFYTPKYHLDSETDDRPDYRSTLYWNPSFRTDAKGRAMLKFYNSDVAKQIQISIEGLSSKGISGSLIQTFGD